MELSNPIHTLAIDSQIHPEKGGTSKEGKDRSQKIDIQRQEHQTGEI